jgi:hypothetical protein
MPRARGCDGMIHVMDVLPPAARAPALGKRERSRARRTAAEEHDLEPFRGQSDACLVPQLLLGLTIWPLLHGRLRIIRHEEVLALAEIGTVDRAHGLGVAPARLAGEPPCHRGWRRVADPSSAVHEHPVPGSLTTARAGARAALARAAALSPRSWRRSSTGIIPSLLRGHRFLFPGHPSPSVHRPPAAGSRATLLQRATRSPGGSGFRDDGVGGLPWNPPPLWA